MFSLNCHLTSACRDQWSTEANVQTVADINDKSQKDEKRPWRA